MKRSLKKLLSGTMLILFFLTNIISQVNTGGTATTANHSKQVIGYITNWDAWKTTSAGLPDAGALTHLNIDYSKYTVLNFSFFGVAVDGSLHSGDYRNKNIYQTGEVQQPADIFYTDIYSSWDLHILFGEIDPIQYIDQAAADRCKVQGFDVQVGGSTWSNTTWGLLNKPLPVPLHKETGAPGLLALAHQKGVKVVASIGGWSMCKHYSAMAADPAKRKRFVDDCKKLINVGFDGIDLDWEYPGPYAGMNFTGTQADFANFTILIQDIRNAIGTGKLITAAFSAAPAKIEGLEWAKLSTLMNYFNFMTYDFNGGWSNKAGHNSPLYTYDGAEEPTFSWKSIYDKLVSLGVPKSKINMGSPFYGRGIITQGSAALNVATVKRSETVQPDGPITTCADYTNWPKEVYDGTPNYFFIKQKALGAGSGWTRKWDNQAKVPYLTNGSYFLSYDDAESIGYKAQFIVDNQLAGTIVWTVYGDLELSGSVTGFGTKLKRWSTAKSELVNKINEVFATGGGGNTPPTVSITNPASGASFTAPASITISANAADTDGIVSKVEFFNGSVSLGVDNTAPYSIAWSNVAVGSYTITALATDDKGASTTSSSIAITVGGGGATCNGLPVYPAGRGSYKGGDRVSNINNIYECKPWPYDGWANLAADAYVPGVGYAWQDAWIYIGPCGNTTNVVPTVSLTSPASGASFTAPASITITATAADSDGSISKVEFFNGSASLGADNTIPYSITWSSVAAGSYTITAVATDDKGATTTSTSVAITVGNIVSGCNGLPVYPAGRGSYKGGDRVSNISNIYECKPWPYDGWANAANAAYEPGVGYAWQDAWTYIGPCGGDTQTVPIAPGSLSASATSSSQINISWLDNSNNESDFRIESSADGTNWLLLTTTAANATTYSHAGLTASTTYYYRVRAENAKGNSNFTSAANATTLSSGNNNGGNLPSKLLVGYWHNFNNGSTSIRLKDVAAKWNVINVAFAETAGDRCSLQFAPFNSTDAEFKSDIALLNSRGQKVVLSVGGQNGVLIVSDNNARDIFVQTAIGLIEKYGFNGIDLDLENNVTVNSGESLDNPANPQIVNLISATRQICDHFGSKFILSMAPEIAYVQGGIIAYGAPWGGYLPIIHKLRDKLSYLHVQHYNCGSSTGLDGKNYNQGTADFEVAMAEMVMKGFPIAGNSSNMFPPLREDQVMIGLPATPGAAPSGGYISPAEMKKALSYLTKGVSYGGGYKLQKSTGYPAFRGLMTWSINWDLTNGSEFLNNYSTYFGSATVTNFTDAFVTEVVSVKDENAEPVLYQNYPNPFASTSTISYRLPKTSSVVLKVLDMMGKEIITLVNAQQNAGDYSVVLDAGKLTPGVYFYKLYVGKYSSLKKMFVVN